jgi:hypothetical protein
MGTDRLMLTVDDLDAAGPLHAGVGANTLKGLSLKTVNERGTQFKRLPL